MSTKSWQNHTELPNNTENSPIEPVKTTLQREALRLYDAGLNVFPQPLGRKSGLPWQRLQYTRLHRDDSRYGVARVFSGRCNLAVMCGRTSGNLFVIDCETKEAFNHHTAEIRKRNIALWSAETARGGHIYLRCKEGEIASIDKGTLPDAEIKACRRYVLAPPSIHPTGVIYQWVTQQGSEPPLIDLTAVNWLRDAAGNPVFLKLDGKPSGRQHVIPLPHVNRSAHLSRTTREYLTSGHNLPEGSRNNRLFSAACDLAGNKYTESQAHQLLSTIALNSGLTQAEITRTIQSAFSKRREPARPPALPTKKRLDWEHAHTFATHHKWIGRTAATDQAVLLALIERAKFSTNENGVFRASIREIAQIARLSTTTVQKSIKRLSTNEPRTIRYIGTDKTSSASLWKFNSHTLQKDPQLKNDTLPCTPPWLSDSVSLFNSDLVERGALGRAGLWLYQVMLALGAGAMPSYLAVRAEMRVHQVNYALRKLRRLGLVERVETGWVAVRVGESFLVSGVSVLCGVAGKGEARRRRYAQERAIYAGRQVLEERIKREGRLLGESSAGTVVSSCAPVLQLSRVAVGGGRVMGSVKLWFCPNCGQTFFGDVPPDMCEGCSDLTTWREMDAASDGGDDPLLALAIELGGVVVRSD